MEFKPTNLPIEAEYPKLIRDKIPEKIEKDGKKSKVDIIKNDKEFLSYLLKKMIEETAELQYSEEHGNMPEELADVIEIIYTILKLKNWSMEDIVTVQKEKREKNGGFEKRLILLQAPIQYENRK